MPTPPTPTLTLASPSSTSFTATIAGGSSGAVHTLYYRKTGALLDTTHSPTLTGNGVFSVTGLEVGAHYSAHVVGAEGGFLSLPAFGWVALAQTNTLAQAVHTHFNADGSLVAAITGGLWTGEVPEGTDPPYAWLDISDVASNPTFEQEFEAARVTVHIYARGAAQAESLAALWKDGFDYETLGFPLGGVSSVMLIPRRYRLVNEMVRYKDSALVYRTVLTYHVLLQKDR